MQHYKELVDVLYPNGFKHWLPDTTYKHLAPKTYIASLGITVAVKERFIVFYRKIPNLGALLPDSGEYLTGEDAEDVLDIEMDTAGSVNYDGIPILAAYPNGEIEAINYARMLGYGTRLDGELVHYYGLIYTLGNETRTTPLLCGPGLEIAKTRAPFDLTPDSECSIGFHMFGNTPIQLDSISYEKIDQRLGASPRLKETDQFGNVDMYQEVSFDSQNMMFFARRKIGNDQISIWLVKQAVPRPVLDAIDDGFGVEPTYRGAYTTFTGGIGVLLPMQYAEDTARLLSMCVMALQVELYKVADDLELLPMMIYRKPFIVMYYDPSKDNWEQWRPTAVGRYSKRTWRALPMSKELKEYIDAEREFHRISALPLYSLTTTQRHRLQELLAKTNTLAQLLINSPCHVCKRIDRPISFRLEHYPAVFCTKCSRGHEPARLLRALVVVVV